MSVAHFSSRAAFRAWLEKHHATEKELHVGFYKAASGKAGMTYLDAVLEALCFGWIDGIVHRVDEERYCHRFTPRKPKSTWSRVNVARVNELLKEGRMHPAGLAAFEARLPEKTGIYSYEQSKGLELTFPSALERAFKKERGAWAAWKQTPPGYRRLATRWVCSAVQESTRLRRLEKLIALTQAGKRVQ